MTLIDAHWMAVARGDEPADLVLAGGKVLSVFTKEWLEVDVAIKDGHVVGLVVAQLHRRWDDTCAQPGRGNGVSRADHDRIAGQHLLRDPRHRFAAHF